jgi:Rad3-related DNA helicase
MTSATMAVARDFGYIRNRLGVDLDSRERTTVFIASSPFDYTRQAALAVPSFVPSPKEDRYIAETNRLIMRIARELHRGMLVLFTSWGHLYRSYHDLRDEFAQAGITLLTQGVDGSRSLILRRFTDETTSVLFGTDSFWEGIDVPGKALELVVITRLPFAVPSDPVVQAQMEEIENTGGDSFLDFSVPEAAIKLRQGAGRLIRHRNDRGVIVVLDKRMITARYGALFRRSLPGAALRAESDDMLLEGLHRFFG